MRTQALALAFLSHAAITFAPSVALAQERPLAPVKAIAVVEREVVQRERVLGSLRAATEAVLAAQEEGPVARFDPREGEAVRAGEPLVVLDTRRLDAQRTALLAAEAEGRAVQVQRAAELDDARQDLAALEAAASSDAISQRDLRRARTALAVAEAQANSALRRLESLAAELQLLDVRVADATLRAPFDGIVVERHVDVGEWVKPGDPVVTFLSHRALEVWLDVPERLLPHARALGSELRVSVGNGEGDRGLVALAPRVVPRIDPRSRTFPIVATLPSPEAEGPAVGVTLAAGMSVSAWVPIGQPDKALLVPKDALVYRPGGVSVMVVMGEGSAGTGPVSGVAAMVPVNIRYEIDREVALAPGAVQPGSLVVVEGNERLFPGTPVLATIAPPSDAAPDAPAPARR